MVPLPFNRERRYIMKYGTKNKVHERRAAFLFILPAVVLLAAFLILPAVSTVRYAFTDYNILRPDKIKFCGLDNFVELFGDRDFKKSLVNTIYFTVVVVPFQCILALLLAMLISSRRKGVSIFRAAYFSPNITSMVVVAILWSVLYNPNPSTGLLNAFLTKLGFAPCGFLTDPKTSMNSIIFMSAWQAAGYQMMIFLAGLQAIPGDQYEAASIDGAGAFQKFLYVTLPGLKNVIKYVVMITMIQAMKLFTQPYVMTQGGPQNSTRTLVYYIYEQGFQSRNFGYRILCHSGHHVADAEAGHQGRLRRRENHGIKGKRYPETRFVLWRKCNCRPDFCIAASVDDCRVPETGGADILRHEQYQDVLARSGHSWELC